MIEQQKNNPLHGVKLEALLVELVDHYGFEILAEQININCFKVNASIQSSLKFLRKTQWARDKLEAFYLYKYKGLPRPDDEQHSLPPRKRLIDEKSEPTSPAMIKLGEYEFFDDPASGYTPSKRASTRTSSTRQSSHARTKVEPKHSQYSQHSDKSSSKSNLAEKSPDPWAKWKEKNSTKPN